MASLEQARAAKRELVDMLGGRDGVSGVGVARVPHEPDPVDDWVVQVNVASSAACDDLPDEIDGVGVRIRVVGVIRAG
ncbi:hypothetical protein [Oerskovia flava]|uniref:hypothetical protein n=1 Tax=Oerskovia flava TaxID=2986422 RepID=UPI0022409EFF|nr:hypothetical protein [Oerskovia sp. JB1-3-2]